MFRSVPDALPGKKAVLAPPSPWTPSTLPNNVVFADIYGQPDLLVDRTQAMSVPAIAKARHLVCTTLSRQPLRQYRDAVEVKAQPAWLYRTNTQTPPQLRMLQTLDDVFFYGWSLWAVERGSEGQVIDATRVPQDRWDFDDRGRVMVDDGYVSNEQVVLIPGPFEGVLAAGARSISGALALEAQWTSRVKNPVPVTELHNNDANEPLAPDESKALVQGYNDNRRNSPDGMTVYTPANIDLRVHGDTAVNLFVEGRNAIALDVARLTGIPAVMLDASQVSASLTYNTTEQGRNDFVDALTNMWAAPIEARLSMDDVCPRGTRVAFDLSNLLAIPQATTGPATED